MAVTSQSTITAVVTAQVRTDILKNLRASLVMQQVATEGTIDKGHGTLIFPQYPDLTADATTLADDGTNPTANALSLSTFTATPNEIGRVVSITRRARAVAPHQLTAIAADILAFDARRRVDTILATAAAAGGTVRYSGTVSARANVVATAASADFRKMNTKLRALNANQWDGNTWLCITDPFVSGDVQAESSGVGGSWQDTNRYATPDQLKAGEVGKLFGSRVLETRNAYIFAAAGSGSADVYTAFFFGQQALGAGSIEGITTTFVSGADKADALDRTTLVGYRLDYGAIALNNNNYGRFETAATAL